jgi:hypothetical protein
MSREFGAVRLGCRVVVFILGLVLSAASVPVFAQLPTGTMTDFKSATQKGLVLDVGDETVLNFSLEVGTPSQELVVTGEAPIVNTTTASLGGLVSEEKLAELPLNGRNYLDLTLLQPGISQNIVVIQLGGGAGGTIYSSNGAPIISNNFLLDGTPNRTFLATTAHRPLAPRWG